MRGERPGQREHRGRGCAGLPADGHQRAASPRAGRARDAGPGPGRDRPARATARRPPPSRCSPSGAGAIGVELNALGAEYHNAMMAPFLAALTLDAPRHAFHMVPSGPPRTPRRWTATSRCGTARSSTRSSSPTPMPATRGPAWLRDQGIPFASFGRVWDDPTFTRWVDVDGHHGTALAVEHCARPGYAAHRLPRLARGVSPVGDDRRDGWRDGLPCGTAGLPGRRSGPDELDGVRRVAAELVAAVGPGGAVVCVVRRVRRRRPARRRARRPAPRRRHRHRRLRRLRAGSDARPHQRAQPLEDVAGCPAAWSARRCAGRRPSAATAPSCARADRPSQHRPATHRLTT